MTCLFGLSRSRLFVFFPLELLSISPIFFCSEAWTTNSCHLKSLQKYHQRRLCHILNIKRRDRRTNSSDLEEANVTSIESIIIKNQLFWAGHIARRRWSRLSKKILYSELTNRKRTGGGGRRATKALQPETQPEGMRYPHRELGATGQQQDLAGDIPSTLVQCTVEGTQ